MLPATAIRVGVIAGLCLTCANASALDSNDSPDVTLREGPRPHEWVGGRRIVVPPEAMRTSPARLWTFGPYVSVQVNVDADGNNIIGDAANEPSIAVDPTDHNTMVIGWRQFDTVQSNFRQAGIGYTSDNGRTWTFPGVLDPGVFRSDPVLVADADGNFYYSSLTVNGNYSCDMFRSFDGGVTWDGPIYAYGGDKAWMAIDRTDGIGRGNNYTAWDYAGCCGNDWFTRSTDNCETFEYPVPIPAQPMWGTAEVGPNGEVYVAGRRSSTDQEFVIAISTTIYDPNAPLEFDTSVEIEMDGRHQYYIGYGPNPGGILGQAWIAADHSDGPTRGNLYLLCSVKPDNSSDPMDVHFVRSTDGGYTWSDPVRVNDYQDGWQWFGTMSVAPNGRIDVIWNDTRNDDSGYDSEVFYSYSTDAGVTWATSVQLTPAFDPHLGWPDQNKLGDYCDMISDDVGANLAYAATFNGEQDVYYLRIGDYDCNGNGIGDAEDIAEGYSADCNANGIPDECEGLLCAADVDMNCFVDIDDLFQVLSAWGLSGVREDINLDGVVDIDDVFAVLSEWGPCPG